MCNLLWCEWSLYLLVLCCSNCDSIIHQVDKISEAIAYPEFIKNDDKLNDFYANVSNNIELNVCVCVHMYV